MAMEDCINCGHKDMALATGLQLVGTLQLHVSTGMPPNILLSDSSNVFNPNVTLRDHFVGNDAHVFKDLARVTALMII